MSICVFVLLQDVGLFCAKHGADPPGPPAESRHRCTATSRVSAAQRDCCYYPLLDTRKQVEPVMMLQSVITLILRQSLKHTTLTLILFSLAGKKYRTTSMRYTSCLITLNWETYTLSCKITRRSVIWVAIDTTYSIILPLLNALIETNSFFNQCFNTDPNLISI